MDLKKYFQEEYNNMEFVNADGEAETIPTHYAEGDEATHFAYGDEENFYAYGDEENFYAEGDEATHYASGRFRGKISGGRQNIGRPGMTNVGRPGMANVARPGMANVARPGMANVTRPNEIVKDEAPTPLILSIVADNTNTGGLIEFLNAIKNATLATPEQLATGVKAYYNIGGITYKQFLTELLGGFSAQIVKMELISDNTTVLLTPITVKQTNLQGELYSKPIIPRFNSFQNLKNQIEIPTNFFLTRETSFEFVIPSGSFSIEYRLYPSRISSNISTLYAGGYTFKQIPQSGYPMIQGGGMPIQRV
jgi:hypothetical protein